MAREARQEQRAALKRRKREKEVREARARQKAKQVEEGGKKILGKTPDLPVVDCVISKGWQERGLAHVLLARRLPTGRLLAGGYYVDTLCVGLKNTAVLPNLDPDEYERTVKPNVFNDPVEFEPCEPSLARAVVEGAIEFAARFGFRPNKRWEESRRLLEGVEAAEGLTFGRAGKPCLVVRPGDTAAGPLARLERTVGPGNYLVEKSPS
ncbi:MAG: hypothetical protein HZB55_04445 [Deltaproteobacteria bacterium]|nr:hypothetical protein [Deltaproteobacteria bacterium]